MQLNTVTPSPTTISSPDTKCSAERKRQPSWQPRKNGLLAGLIKSSSRGQKQLLCTCYWFLKANCSEINFLYFIQPELMLLFTACCMLRWGAGKQTNKKLPLSFLLAPINWHRHLTAFLRQIKHATRAKASQIWDQLYQNLRKKTWDV